MIGDDMRLSVHLHACLKAHPEFEALTQGLSITTFRYVPAHARAGVGSDEGERYLDRLNRRLLTAIEQSGEAFLSSAVVDGRFALRACIVNFHTSLGDVEALLPLVACLGAQIDAALEHEAVAEYTTPAGDAPAHIERSR
jgi:glutamate/tyrosine decarboxylase-like PLP-dependent enzyme